MRFAYEKMCFFICFILYFSGCTKKESIEKYPIIDLIGSAEKYQRVYCSDFFSSIELIPLETCEECLLPNSPFPQIILKDSLIFIKGDLLCAFDTLGIFLNHIGKRGQGPHEYLYSTRFFLNAERPTIYVEDLKKILTEKYSASQTIKDQQSHQKLKKILKTLKYDDNPVVVVAHLK